MKHQAKILYLKIIKQFCFGQINDFEGLSNHEDYSSYRLVVFKSFMGSTTEYNLKESRVTDLIFYFSKDNILVSKLSSIIIKIKIFV